MELGEGSRFTSDELGHESYFSVSPLIQELSETGIQAVDPARKAGVQPIVRSSVLGTASNSVPIARRHFAVERAVEAGDRDLLNSGGVPNRPRLLLVGGYRDFSSFFRQAIDNGISDRAARDYSKIGVYESGRLINKPPPLRQPSANCAAPIARIWSEPLKWHTKLGTVSGKGNTG